VVLKPENLDVSSNRVRDASPNTRVETLHECSNEGDGKLEQLLHQAYEKDPLVADILEALRSGQRRHTKISWAECEIQEDRLYHRDCLYIPAKDKLRLHLIKQHHDRLAAGHPGVDKTLELLSR